MAKYGIESIHRVTIVKQTLVLGSTVVDVLLNVPALPQRGNDINITASEYRIGGCAYNVYSALRLFKSPALLCSPVGSGVYGSMVRDHLEREGVLPIVNLEKANGCCYCLIEPDGERTFLSHHGAEYLFSRSWMKGIDLSQAGGIYVSGIELEESSAGEILGFVYEHPHLELCFAPGPRITHISPEIMGGLLYRRDRNGKGPLLHLNGNEAMDFSGQGSIEEAAEFLTGKTGNMVIITLGEQGCYCLEGAGSKGAYIPGFPVRALDTVGAGDAHCGALMACLKGGMSLPDSCMRANRIGAALVGIGGERNWSQDMDVLEAKP